jgi:hypothetical protein
MGIIRNAMPIGVAMKTCAASAGGIGGTDTGETRASNKQHHCKKSFHGIPPS